MQWTRALEHRFEDAPSFLDAVFAREKLTLADQPGVQKTFVRPHRRAEVGGE